jgi:HNH endonuclease/NUMOD4 motif-containing protein/NUMOD1 domain-containing protein
MSAESFRGIPGFPGYEVSDKGRVRNSARNNTMMSVCKNGAGYMVINLRKEGCRHNCYVHRLVMLTFVGPPPRGTSVDHIDRDPSNNQLNNLKYATRGEQRANQVQVRSRYTSYRKVQRLESKCDTYESVSAAAKDMQQHQPQELRYYTDAIYRALASGKQWKGYNWRAVMTDETNSCWRDIRSSLIGGVSGYAASENGEIKLKHGRITKGSRRPDGYCYVGIAGRIFSVHRLVAGTFLPAPTNEKATLVNHLNGIKDDNRLVNLQFATHAENTQHAVDTGLLVAVGRSISKYSLEGELLDEFPTISEAARSLGKSFKNLSACCRGKRQSAYGFVWKYSSNGK